MNYVGQVAIKLNFDVIKFKSLQFQISGERFGFERVPEVVLFVET